jgi:transcription factor E2F3
MGERQSLVTVTQGFLKIMSEAEGGDVDLSVAEQTLKTTKRRLYDVVNVLAGVGLVVRSGKSRVRWTSRPCESPLRPSSDLSDRERELDALLSQVDSDLLEISNSELFHRFGWIDTADASMCASDDEVAVYSLKGPPTMRIVIDPNGPDSDSHTIVCSVEDGSAGTIELAPVHRKPLLGQAWNRGVAK